MTPPVTTTTPDKRRIILRHAEACRYLRGAFVELGVYGGSMLIDIAKKHPTRTVLGFDTFAGLPAESFRDGEPHKPGDFSDTSLSAVQEATRPHANIILHAGHFPDSTIGVDCEKVAFAHVDFDFYLSTVAAIKWLEPRLVVGARVVFDDYEWKHCPGVKQAIDEAGWRIKRPHLFQALYIHRRKRK